MSRDQWLGIELRHFAALAAVAHERSFRRGADRLGYVQSAVSRQIAYLEQMTGQRLIERSQGPKPVMLTEAGELLLNHANDILASIEAAKADMSDLQGGRSGDVRVGFFPGVPMRILAPTLVAFGKRHPGARVAARESPTDAPLLDLVRQGSIDMAFTYLPVGTGPFATYELMTVPWVLVVPASADIARRSRTPTAEEIGRLPFIGGQSNEADEWCKGDFGTALGERLIVFRSDSTETAQALAGAGLGAAIVPRLAVHEGDPRTAIIDLSEYLPPASVGVAWLSDHEFGAALEHFLELLIQVCAVLSRQQDAVQPLAA